MDELDYSRLALPAAARERLKNLDTKRTEAFLEKARVYPDDFTTHTNDLIVGRLRDFKLVLIESGVPAEEHEQRLREHMARVDEDMEDLMKIEARKLPSDQQGTALLNCIWAFGRRSELIGQCLSKQNDGNAPGSPDGIAEQTLNELLAWGQSPEQVERQQLDAESGQAAPANAENGSQLDVEKINKWITDEGYTNKTLAKALNCSARVITSLRNNGDSHGRKVVIKLANLMKCDEIDLYRSEPA
jgi:hypothetical protein